MRLGRIEISCGAVAVAAILFYCDRDGVAPWLLLACTLHELGHWWAIRALGGKVRSGRLSCVGAELHLSPATPLSPQKLTLAALAGPAMNLLLAGGSAFLARRGLGVRLYLFAGLNLGLAGFNLLPAGRLDGGRALTGVLCWMGKEELAERVTQVGSFTMVVLLFAVGGMLFWQSGGRNFTVILAAFWMLGTLLGKSEEEKI